jgi:hypothetical protein
VGVISVESASLAWLGEESERLAGMVVSATPAMSGGLRATSLAIRGLHDEVDEAARRIADRLQLTGEAASTAASAFASTEATNEDRIYEV